MPLIQSAMALKYGRPVDEVAVGVQAPMVALWRKRTIRRHKSQAQGKNSMGWEMEFAINSALENG